MSAPMSRTMNQRERFLATAGFRPVDRTFLLAPWAWPETIRRRRGESEPVTKTMGHETAGVFDDAALRRMSGGLAAIYQAMKAVLIFSESLTAAEHVECLIGNAETTSSPLKENEA